MKDPAEPQILPTDTSRGVRTMRWYSVFANFLDGISVMWIKNGRYSLIQSSNGDGKIQFLMESTTVTILMQKIDFAILVIFEKTNGDTVI